MRKLIYIIVGGLAAYAAGTIDNLPFQFFCGFVAFFCLSAVYISFMEGD